ncbi:MAG: peptide deformylase [Clostridia bacterium]
MYNKYEGKTLILREVGDPALRNKCYDVDINNIDETTLNDIKDMKKTLDYTGGFGIAAPQIAINKNIIIIQVDKKKCKYNDSEDIPTTVMINPSWKKTSDDTDIEYEGCLSVPSISGKVERYKNIEVTYYNENGEKIIKEVKGFTARDIQHECDHLKGIVFIDKVVNNEFATKKAINKFELK